MLCKEENTQVEIKADKRRGSPRNVDGKRQAERADEIVNDDRDRKRQEWGRDWRKEKAGLVTARAKPTRGIQAEDCAYFSVFVLVIHAFFYVICLIA